jgi:TonB-dependent starch-binding outer membrane protein SusC
MKKILQLSIFLLLIITSLSVIAQERAVSGKVTSADDGSAMPGVNVVLKGTSTGVVSDLNGEYRIPTQGSGGVLVFSFIGMISQEIEIGSRSVIDVQLAVDVTQLSEVVVVGYGTSLKKDLTGAVANVTSKDIQNLPTLSVDQSLQGLASGVFVSSNSGAPGGGISIRIRGQNSISGSNAPLYVVDGVIIQSGSLAQRGFGGQGENALSGLNPQDIESMQVLKDAASTAIYGARASNGVVLITTKRGRQGGNNIDISAWTGFAEAVKLPTLTTAEEWVMVRREAADNDAPGSIPLTNTALGWDGTTNTNWIDEVFRTARISQYQINSSGGDGKFNYYLSGSYRNEEGTIIGSSFDRFTGRLNLDYNASSKLRISASVGVSSQLNKRITNDNNIFGIYSAAILTPPTQRIRDDDGNFVDALPGFNTNAVRDATNARFDNTTNKLTTNVNFTYNLLDGLDFRTDLSYDYTMLREDHFIPVESAQGRGTNGSGNFNTREVSTYIVEPTLRYVKTLNQNHRVSGVVGLTFQGTDDLRSSTTGTGFARSSLTYLTSSATPTASSSLKELYSFNSIFGRVTYSLNDKYVVEGTIRRDGSSRFGPNKRFGTFYAASAAWNFTEESFMDGISFLEAGKLRASFGVTGNDRIGNFTYIGSFTGGANYLDQPASAPDQIANNNLQWEQTQKTDIGLELGFFKNRLNLNAGYYISTSTKLLFDNPVPLTSGFADVSANIGNIQNNGIELELNGVIINTGGFRWSAGANITFLENKVVDLLSDDQPILRGFSSAIIKGQPLNTFYGLRWLGVDPATGKSVFDDVNGDGIITTDDNVVTGDAQPNQIGGITTQFSYKGFTLDVFGQFVNGVDVYNNTLAFSLNPANNFGKDARILDRWQQPGDITNIPKLTRGSEIDYSLDNSRFLSDGSYFRLKNITLGYNLPSAIVGKARLRSVRVYASAQNLLTLTNYNGPDPEISTFGETNTSQGTDFLTQPQNKLFTFGINIGL